MFTRLSEQGDRQAPSASLDPAMASSGSAAGSIETNGSFIRCGLDQEVEWAVRNGSLEDPTECREGLDA